MKSENAKTGTKEKIKAETSGITGRSAPENADWHKAQTKHTVGTTPKAAAAVKTGSSKRTDESITITSTADAVTASEAIAVAIGVFFINMPPKAYYAALSAQ